MDEWITCDHWASEWMWWFNGMRSVDDMWSLDEWMTWYRWITCDEWMNDMWSPTHITEGTANPQGHAFIHSSPIIHSLMTGHPLISCHSLIQWSHVDVVFFLNSQSNAKTSQGWVDNVWSSEERTNVMIQWHAISGWRVIIAWVNNLWSLENKGEPIRKQRRTQ